MNKAIEKAIEGGYSMFGFAEKSLFKWWIDTSYKDHRMLVGYDYAYRTEDDRSEIQHSHDYIWVQAILLDPLFWQALGKALGWEKYLEDRKWGDKGQVPDPMWIRKWHRFIDHRASGGNTESFFNELLK